MQKAFSLNQDEQQQAAQLEGEHRDLLAQLGAISLDRKRIKKALPANEEKQRGLLRRVIDRHGVEQYTAARLQGTNLVVEIPDAPPALPAPPPIDGHVNGAAVEKEN